MMFIMASMAIISIVISVTVWPEKKQSLITSVIMKLKQGAWLQDMSR